MINVVIADDQDLVRTGFGMILGVEDDITVVGEAGDGAEAIEVVRAGRPDVVLMDIRMPRLDGIQATRVIVREPDPPRVVMLTTFDADEHVWDALDAGATGFLLKNAPAQELVDAVRLAAVGDHRMAPEIVRRLAAHFLQAPRPGSGRPELLSGLTSRELDVLRELGRGRSNSEIGQQLFVSEATVRTHLNRIFAKLHLRDRAQAVVVAYETGLVRPGE